MDYNENDQPILPPLSDIIRTFREERITQPRPEPIMPVDLNPIFDVQYGITKMQSLMNTNIILMILFLFRGEH